MTNTAAALATAPTGAELLLELRSEEIPARMQAGAAASLRDLLIAALTDVGLAPTGAVSTESTPRRLVFSAEGVPTRQPDRREERRGPRVGAPEQALAGFLKANGLTSIDQATVQENAKGSFYFAVIDQPGADAHTVLPEVIIGAINRLVWPKSMRWASYQHTWVRPLQSIIAAFDGQPLPGAYDIGGGQIDFGSTSYGHRFLGPDAFTATSLPELIEKLEAGHVLLSRARRREAITAGVASVTAAAGLAVVDDPGLLDEVVGLVEWPVPLLGRFDQDFLSLPREVLTTSMRSHQKYFAVQDQAGMLAPAFVVVANTIPTDGGAAIVNGNERVLRARLSDAHFFWRRDLDTKLEQLLPALSPMVFHAKLGSLTDRIARLEALARALAVDLDADGDAAARAARLCKADLVTGTVGEFPELQGIVGQYLARAQGEDEAVAQAIGDHYAPSGPSDRCPTAPVAIAVALADKLDTLMGFFGIEQKPTGSRDPFSLRRAALGVLRILVENRQSLSLTQHLGQAWRAYTAPLAAADDTVAAVLGFMRDRFRVMLRDVGHRHDRVDAVLGHGLPFDDPLDVVTRLEALGALLDQDDGRSLVATYKRAANILRIEDKKDGPHPAQVDAVVLSETAEVALHDALVAVTGNVQATLQQRDYAGAMARLAALRSPLDAFFADITVNTDDAAIRRNRLGLLAMVRDATVTVADFGALEG